jgi:diguanylate cyclase (GGDEF)-like protein
MNEEDVKKRRFSLKGTLLEDIAINRQPFYFRDVKYFKKRPLPFDYHEIRSLAGFPLLSGKDITGMVVLASPQPEALTERHLSIMHLYCNQASESVSRALLHEDIKMKALTDGLTGLYNHRHFQERLEENIKRAERLKENLSLMLLDIDHFKKINDTYGHPVGDQVLRTLASTIDETVREIDIPARYGGEEFGVLLLGAGKNEAQQVAERLRERVKNLRFNSSSGDFSITVSIGIATFPEDATTRETLIERADEALYRAKNSGRDRVVLA